MGATCGHMAAKIGEKLGSNRCVQARTVVVRARSAPRRAFIAHARAMRVSSGYAANHVAIFHSRSAAAVPPFKCARLPNCLLRQHACQTRLTPARFVYVATALALAVRICCYHPAVPILFESACTAHPLSRRISSLACDRTLAHASLAYDASAPASRSHRLHCRRFSRTDPLLTAASRIATRDEGRHR